MLFERGIEIKKPKGIIRYGWYKNELFRLPFKNYPVKHIPVKTSVRKKWSVTEGRALDYPYQVIRIDRHERSLKWMDENTKIVNWYILDVEPSELDFILFSYFG
jgi:hypothetical protein